MARPNAKKKTYASTAEIDPAAYNVSRDDFAALLDESLNTQTAFEGSVVKGTVLTVDNEFAIVDVGLKMEGRIPLKEFAVAGKPADLKPGDTVDVFLDRIENALGEAVLSRDKARREESWTRIEKAFVAGERVTGVIYGRVKGGFTVDLDGASAFLPGSQVDVRPVKDVTPLMNIPQPFQILKMDRRRGNIVVSRRAILEQDRAGQRSEFVSGLREGQIIEGQVKNITDYGAFVELEPGIDGLLHVTDIAWRRVNHPSEILQVGQTVRVQVVKVNPDTQRISLGMKQLEADPWSGAAAKYPVGGKFKGRVTNITDYGAFVELEPGVEGLVHVSEMSWVKKNVLPGRIVSTSQEVDVVVLEVDGAKRRISLGLKQAMRNPWEAFIEAHPVGSIIEGEVKSFTEYGMFIGVDAEIDGMAHVSDLSWDKSGEKALKDYKKDDVVRAVVLEVNVDEGRVSLGVKQAQNDPLESLGNIKKNDIVTCEVVGVQESGLEVQIGDVKAFIRRAELARDRSEQRPERFAVGDKIDARVTNVDRTSRKIQLSVKAREMAEEKEAMAQYGSADSGASLGDILGAALAKGVKK